MSLDRLLGAVEARRLRTASAVAAVDAYIPLAKTAEGPIGYDALAGLVSVVADDAAALARRASEDPFDLEPIWFACMTELGAMAAVFADNMTSHEYFRIDQVAEQLSAVAGACNVAWAADRARRRRTIIQRGRPPVKKKMVIFQ